jgi:hypothetical protein
MSRMTFDDELELVIDDFVQYSELSYESEYLNWLDGKNWSWLLTEREE